MPRRVHLGRYDELSYQKIVDNLEISLQSVKNQMNKALSILLGLLAEHEE